MALGKSPYTKSSGNISWATEQLVSALIKGQEAEYIAALAMGFVGGKATGSKKGKGQGGALSPTAKISFKSDLFKRYESHVFSQDHIKKGIMKLGKDRLSIFNSVTSKIGQVDPSKIKIGSNQMFTKINGHEVTIRFFADKNGTIINVDAFMGKTTRLLGNQIN
ncbi:polymorphic toxin type 35 domain-containing protein [Paenibacillus sp. PAMC 26794]|uniref:polymorphic toxin type 35 domain-containing protein n=1 Tax=Paenibacillus sp. PAMC 26794 TaxID=1257080 RepID=UPI0003024835